MLEDNLALICTRNYSGGWREVPEVSCSGAAGGCVGQSREMLFKHQYRDFPFFQLPLTWKVALSPRQLCDSVK